MPEPPLSPTEQARAHRDVAQECRARAENFEHRAARYRALADWHEAKARAAENGEDGDIPMPRA